MSFEKVSVIIRTKNEYFWLRRLMPILSKQSSCFLQLVIIDNYSKYPDVELIKSYINCGAIKEIIVLNIENYLPGKALNLGVSKCKYDLIVILSAHCIPKTEEYISQLTKAVIPNEIAGAYSRQLPLPCSGAQNTIDLILAYPPEDRVMRRTPIFNNASSIVKKEALNKVTFSNEVSNMEDFLWAKNILSHGYCLKYIHNAEVYHYHGIHQHDQLASSNRVLGGLKTLDSNSIFSIDTPYWLKLENLSTLLLTTTVNKKKISKKSFTINLNDYKNNELLSNILKKNRINKFILDFIIIANNLTEKDINYFGDFVRNNVQHSEWISEWDVKYCKALLKKKSTLILTPMI